MTGSVRKLSPTEVWNYSSYLRMLRQLHPDVYERERQVPICITGHLIDRYDDPDQTPLLPLVFPDQVEIEGTLRLTNFKKWSNIELPRKSLKISEDLYLSNNEDTAEIDLPELLSVGTNLASKPTRYQLIAEKEKSSLETLLPKLRVPVIYLGAHARPRNKTTCLIFNLPVEEALSQNKILVSPKILRTQLSNQEALQMYRARTQQQRQKEIRSSLDL